MAKQTLIEILPLQTEVSPCPQYQHTDNDAAYDMRCPHSASVIHLSSFNDGSEQAPDRHYLLTAHCIVASPLPQFMVERFNINGAH